VRHSTTNVLGISKKFIRKELEYKNKGMLKGRSRQKKTTPGESLVSLLRIYVDLMI
jgi:hypothetical protein